MCLLQVQHEIGSWKQLHRRIQDHRILLVAAAMNSEEQHANAKSEQELRVQNIHDEYLDRLAKQKIALVLGSEGQGVRSEILQKARRIAIPMADTMESLNVAAAGSMAMLVLSQRAIQGVLMQIVKHLV